MNWYLDVLKKYAVFEGRARRQEYWMFVLCNVVIAFVIGFVLGLVHAAKAAQLLLNLYQLAILVPSIAVGIRRMHDTDHSGWWLLVPIVNLVFACTDSTPGPNRFGPNPKEVEQPA